MARNPKIDELVKELIEEIKSSGEYLNFVKYKKEAMEDSELRQKIERTRMIRKQLAELPEYEKDSNISEALVDEYDYLMDTTAVHEFSLAELGFINLYKDVIAEIVGSFEIDL